MEATESRALEALNKLIKYNRDVNHNLYVDRDLLDITIKINELVVDNSRMREQLRKLDE
ncbi:hypothetical protein [Ligilactobacillus ruminis]|uniref:Uncharacterized protein n=1 Tax=Ligilactobacillus ruminis DSM 20403 = NBRC 102161 TaxID=1423798 RepID=A0A1I2RNV2_9LACO|nr:hypothetical protein [Ligilactobacillus ruminis]KRM82808.1 hypothetical protein FC25_GL000389 [Ligilactobacillus ruminis DSM 20403 = NBRC 102161]MCF2543746.1 hypothetical protein [Ligilactobacillus ruminis]MDD5957901.1 hypothetical protein [Ligilactobacillus ruminis]NME31306.1 hypothetical protein [Ligilactobacillus ruminis]SFG41149.1 hypothetical protein SAMN02910432_01250 [Ligilactobacillus ruminis DSM 20403 = NBRC 102161]